MTAPRFSKWFSKCLAAGVLFAAGTTELRADEYYDTMDTSMYVDNTDHDLQFFSPVDFDFENQPIEQCCGFSFSYEKLSWAATGERTTIGDQNVVVLSEEIYNPNNPDDINGDPPPQYLVQNGIQNAPPDATFSLGERYEFGYSNGETGWSIGILDGPANNNFQTYGNGPQTSGFGSIHVNFQTTPDLLLGFRDYWSIFPPVVDGPGIGRFFIDDYNGNGLDGFFFVFNDGNGNGQQDDDEPTIGIGIDYGDLYEFNVTFNRINVRNLTETQGVEVMKTINLDNRHHLTKRQNEHIQIGYGVRFLRINDVFNFNGTSDLLTGTNFADTESENQIVGPQVRAQWSKQWGRWNLAADGRFLFGVNIQDLSQRGVIGENLLPGSPDQPMILQPTAFHYGKQEQNFSPTAEIRIDSSYQVTRAIALKLGYTGIFVDNISRSSQIVHWRLPDMGLKEGGNQEIFINGVNFGFDVVY